MIIMRFGENNVLGPKYIDMYQFRWLVGEEGWGVTGRPPYIFCLLFIKIEKVQECDLY